jgi:hypothetical protein
MTPPGRCAQLPLRYTHSVFSGARQRGQCRHACVEVAWVHHGGRIMVAPSSLDEGFVAIPSDGRASKPWFVPRIIERGRQQVMTIQ